MPDPAASLPSAGSQVCDRGLVASETAPPGVIRNSTLVGGSPALLVKRTLPRFKAGTASVSKMTHGATECLLPALQRKAVSPRFHQKCGRACRDFPFPVSFGNRGRTGAAVSPVTQASTTRRRSLDATRPPLYTALDCSWGRGQVSSPQTGPCRIRTLSKGEPAPMSPSPSHPHPRSRPPGTF